MNIEKIILNGFSFYLEDFVVGFIDRIEGDLNNILDHIIVRLNN